MVNAPSLDRDSLVGAIRDEVLGWRGRERRGAFKRWQQNAISLVHLNVLGVLEESGPIPIGRLADAIDVSVASATGIVSRMEERNLVARTHGAPGDRRIVLVELAEGGKQAFADLESSRTDHFSRLLGEMTDAELAATLEGFRALRAAGERARAHEHVHGTSEENTNPDPSASVERT